MIPLHELYYAIALHELYYAIAHAYDAGGRLFIRVRLHGRLASVGIAGVHGAARARGGACSCKRVRAAHRLQLCNAVQDSSPPQCTYDMCYSCQYLGTVQKYLGNT